MVNSESLYSHRVWDLQRATNTTIRAYNLKQGKLDVVVSNMND